MTPEELRLWTNRKWPCGHASTEEGLTYIRGPAGGASRNLFCPVCGLGLNVPDPEEVPEWMHGAFGQVIREPDGYVPPVAPPPAPDSIWKKFLNWFTPA